MSKRYNYKRKSNYHSKSIGHKYAIEHIKQAEALSKELGGTDEDVKAYFFSLSAYELSSIMNKYESTYGKEARKYAENTMEKWKNGNVHMSGVVAERLFSLLPPIMPLETKYKLVSSLWEYVGTSSKKTYYIPPNVCADDVVNVIREHFEQVAVNYKIPDGMENRFNWLSHGDIEIKQQLLNHLKNQEKMLVAEALRNQLIILSNHLQSENGKYTNDISQVLKVGKHEVQVIFDKGAVGITENKYRSLRKNSDENLKWIWWIIGGIFILWLLNK